jgi:hypothetical protein
MYTNKKDLGWGGLDVQVSSVRKVERVVLCVSVRERVLGSLVFMEVGSSEASVLL